MIKFANLIGGKVSAETLTEGKVDPDFITKYCSNEGPPLTSNVTTLSQIGIIDPFPMDTKK